MNRHTGFYIEGFKQLKYIKFGSIKLFINKKFIFGKNFFPKSIL